MYPTTSTRMEMTAIIAQKQHVALGIKRNEAKIIGRIHKNEQLLDLHLALTGLLLESSQL